MSPIGSIAQALRAFGGVFAALTPRNPIAAALLAGVLSALAQPALPEEGVEAIEIATTDGGADVADAGDPHRGSETGLPIPRFVTLKSGNVNARRGPSLSHRVDWVFVRAGMPVEVIAEHGNWRKVRDQDGASGWVHHSLIRGARSVIVVAPEALLMDKPSVQSRPVARAERGVLAKVDECAHDWCDIEADGYEGWAQKTALWGVGAEEVFD